MKSFYRHVKQFTTIVGVSQHEGQSHKGVELGPQYLRQAGLTKQLTKLGWIVKDEGNIQPTHQNLEDLPDILPQHEIKILNSEILGPLC